VEKLILIQDLRTFQAQIIHSADVPFYISSCIYENKFYFIDYLCLIYIIRNVQKCVSFIRVARNGLS
jgi:hypothetical protein